MSLNKIINEYKSQGINPVVFDLPLSTLLTYIREKKEANGVLLSDRLLEPDFRFLSRDEPEISKEVTDTFAEFAQHLKSSILIKGARAQARESANRRTEKAQSFAENLYPLIENLKKAEGISSFKDTVNMLNQKGIKTPKGARWHVKTLHALYKRCQ